MHSKLGIENCLWGRYHPPQSKDLRGDTAEFGRPQKKRIGSECCLESSTRQKSEDTEAVDQEEHQVD